MNGLWHSLCANCCLTPSAMCWFRYSTNQFPTSRIDHSCQAGSLGHNWRSQGLWGVFVLTVGSGALSYELVVQKVRWGVTMETTETLQPWPAVQCWALTWCFTLPLRNLTPSAKRLNTSLVSHERGEVSRVLVTFCLIKGQFEALSVGFNCVSPQWETEKKCLLWQMFSP